MLKNKALLHRNFYVRNIIPVITSNFYSRFSGRLVQCRYKQSTTMEADAIAYEKLNKPQHDAGCKFIDEINLSQGTKVLDMGCGTGNLTKYIADIVGSCGQAVGIDPDVERIKIAQHKYQEVGNLQFHVGDSVAGYPNNNTPYYDVHITTYAFHWFPHEHKKIYIQKAYQSLKPGGKLALLFLDRIAPKGADESERLNFHYLSKDEVENLFQTSGLFRDFDVRQFRQAMHYNSYEIFKCWVKASTHRNIDDLDPAFVKQILGDYAIFHDNGSITLNAPSISIRATKH